MINQMLECCDCGHTYLESEAKRLPDPECSIATKLVCPKCECETAYEVTDGND